MSVDAKSNIIWHNTDHKYHHSINQDYDENIWACSKELLEIPSAGISYSDEYLTKIDVKTGKVLFHKSLTELFIENDLSYLIFGLSNIVGDKGQDPFHLNEIEPALTSGLFWKKGDLFLSLRNRSMIVVFRPSTNEVIKIIQGPFFNQHDVDILSDSTISIFNNNVSNLKTIKKVKGADELNFNMLPNMALNRNSEVLIYNFMDSSFTSVFPQEFEKNKVYTKTQGLHQILKNGDLFVDQYSEGKVYIFGKSGTILRKYFNDPINELVEYTHWVRVYEDLDFLKN